MKFLLNGLILLTSILLMSPLSMAGGSDGQKSRAKKLISRFLRSNKKEKNDSANPDECEKKLPAIYFEYDKKQTEQLKNYLNGLIEEHRISGNRPNPSFLSASIREFVNHGADPNVESSISTA